MRIADGNYFIDLGRLTTKFIINFLNGEALTDRKNDTT